MQVEIYSDVVCPWCYIGERRFARALDGFPGAGDVRVAFRPYQLDPDAPGEAVPLSAYLQRRFGPGAAAMQAQVSAAARAEGIEIDWERALAANTRTAHRLMRLAALEYGEEVQRALAGRLFALHFTRGGDVSDAEQLAGAAAEAGMDRARAAEYLASGEGEEALEAEFEAARRLGIRAVPTFVFDGRFAVQGAQPPEALRAALERAASAPGEG